MESKYNNIGKIFGNLEVEEFYNHISKVIHFQKYGTGTDDRYIEPINNKKET